MDALIGGDILSNFRVGIDWHKRTLSLSNDRAPIAGSSGELSLWSNVPLIDLSLPSHELRVFLDTGAAYSYLCSDVDLEGAAVGEVSDFYPGFGSFTTPLVQLPVLVAGQRFIANFGRLPPLLEMSLPLGGAKGIVGADLLRSYVVTIDYPARRFSLGSRLQA